MKKRRGLSLFLAVILAFLSAQGVDQSAGKDTKKQASAQTQTQDLSAQKGEGQNKIIEIDGRTARTEENSLFRGLGAVTANGSSRLLLDYKEENEDAYWEIMNWLFNTETGIGLTHIKIELGCDSDTSSGAEPATKREKSETANVNRGAGFVFAHDALTINPDITVDMLCWGMPAWVENAYEKSDTAGFKARYRWYKETIDAAYDEYGIRFSYISANRNERSVEKKWTIYLRDALDSETDGRYDYSTIKLVAADESDTMNVAAQMLSSKKYRDAVDVIGCHYNSYMDENVKKLHDDYGKEIWFSEGASVATDSVYGANNSDDGTTTSGTNGMLDIANRIIIAMAQSDMTLYEFQPAVAAYYDGSVYYPKQLLAANTPWSGDYTVTNGLVMAMHFTNFIGKGWQIIDSASYGDGTQSNHTIFDTKDDYLTAMDPDTQDYSVVITNDSDAARTYTVNVSHLAQKDQSVTVWETKTSATDAYDENWLCNIGTITPEQNKDYSSYEITVEPYAMVTLTTTTGQKDFQTRKAQTSLDKEESGTTLALPYTDDFEYDSDYLERRGGTPRYTSDVNGAFEVEEDKNGNHVLCQQIDRDHKSSGWGGTKDPVTSLGDDTWKDYTVSADVMLDADEKGKNYAGICARYNAVSSVADNGYWLKIYRSGKWELSSNQGVLESGKISGMREGRKVNLKLTVMGNTVSAAINGKEVACVTVKKSVTNSGRVALCSAYNNNSFDNIKVLPADGGVDAVTRVDDLSSELTYTGTVVRRQSQSYAKYGRTVSELFGDDASVEMTFLGTGISFLGANDKGIPLRVTVDGETKESAYTTKKTGERSAFYQVSGLSYGEHTVTLSVTDTSVLYLDAVETDGSIREEETTEATKLSVVKDEIRLTCGESVSLGLAAEPALAAYNITYTTSDMAVAVVTSDGMVYGNGAGTATVTATAANGMSASATVTVTELVLSPQSGIRAGAGEKVKLTAAFADKKGSADIVSWSSSDERLATVNQKGVVQTKKAGNVTITATAANGVTGSAVVHILQEPYRLTLTAKKKTLTVGETKKIKYEIPSGCYAGTADFKSNKKSVATVNVDGVVKAKKKGKCKVTVKLYNGKKKTVRIVVK